MAEERQTYSDAKIDKLRELLEMVDDSELSSIKSTVSELVRLINDPKSSARDLKEVIQLDPPLTAKLLKLANSAYYGFPRTIGDIQDAVVCVGFNELKELALNQKISQIFNDEDVFAGYSRRLLWKHSVAVAVCGKLIYALAFNDKGGAAYVAGLIHDIGIVIEDQFLLDAFFQILDAVGGEGADFNEMENKVLSYDHTDIGNAIALEWNFPDETAAAIRYHHNPKALDHPEYERLTYTLYVADYVCQGQNVGFGDASMDNKETFRYCLDKLNAQASTKLNDNNLAEMAEEVKKQIARMEKAGWF